MRPKLPNYKGAPKTTCEWCWRSACYGDCCFPPGWATLHRELCHMHAQWAEHGRPHEEAWWRAYRARQMRQNSIAGDGIITKRIVRPDLRVVS